MEKARLKISELIRKIDVVIEVLDARLPASSSNKLLEELRRDKPCIKVMNKNDLADPAVTRAWVRYFEKHKGMRALPLSAKQYREVNQLTRICLSLAPNRINSGRSLRVMVVGIPNVGKSTLINTLAGKCMAKVGDKPAITTCAQQIDLRNGIVLSDTPGLLWPDMSDQIGAYRLASSGAVGAGAIEYTELGLFAADFMMQRYRELLMSRYDLKVLPDNGNALLEQIGRRLGCLVTGGVVDMQRAAEAFLRELRTGKIGRVSFEEPLQHPLEHPQSLPDESDSIRP
jgi:ribosome biogenesis GTPase A